MVSSDDEVLKRTLGMLKTKYGEPELKREGSDLTATWQRKDGVRIRILRADSDMMLIYEVVDVGAALDQEIKADDASKRQQEIQEQSRAF
jgi:hypothetical protein